MFTCITKKKLHLHGANKIWGKSSRRPRQLPDINHPPRSIGDFPIFQTPRKIEICKKKSIKNKQHLFWFGWFERVCIFWLNLTLNFDSHILLKGVQSKSSCEDILESWHVWKSTLSTPNIDVQNLPKSSIPCLSLFLSIHSNLIKLGKTQKRPMKTHHSASVLLFPKETNHLWTYSPPIKHMTISWYLPKHLGVQPYAACSTHEFKRAIVSCLVPYKNFKFHSVGWFYGWLVYKGGSIARILQTYYYTN